ncbi:hypothetical protein HYALB_00002421 [Hymenoscyphus albidus]|uniref:Uncharacterized protein n=1 Tax=Hymenoscyphus albidus TaxID=595503 RepID=A0A9N9Q1I9_9HELO|nr:hypothetical protein HYALB_00002421 [Hymenoscyphus albidus]
MTTTLSKREPWQDKYEITTMSVTLSELEEQFNEHPSLDESLGDFDRLENKNNFHPRSPSIGYPSHHSGFRSETSSEMGDSSLSGGRFSPPAWRRDGNGNRSSGFWNRGQSRLGLGGGDSRDGTPECESGDERDRTLEAAARVRLPTGSLSPEKQRSPSPAPNGYPKTSVDFTDFANGGKAYGTGVIKQEDDDAPANPNNYIRFAMKAEVQHRTEPFEVSFNYMKSRFNMVTRSKTSLFISALVGLFAILGFRSLFQPAPLPPVPDLVKVAGLAKSFEPLIFYSENGVQQIGDLQATGTAVWDLGESVRSTNMTSGPIIVKSLDDLGESLKTLALELTRFFANVDGDVDGILIVMDWAKRELSQLQSNSPSALTSAFDNIHSLFSRSGLLENEEGDPTPVGEFATLLFGLTSPQRTRQTLQRTFTEFLGVLEDSIQSELQHSLALFALFEAIDKQFLNLARTVVRESSAQESTHDDMLSSLWTKILGPNASTIQKFEKNKRLLSNIRAKTVQNKSVLLEHNGKLLTLKANLETLRRKLVSPLVRANGSTLGVDEQIRGLEEVSNHLSGVREKQKGKLMEMLYGSGSNSGRRIAGADLPRIEEY